MSKRTFEIYLVTAVHLPVTYLKELKNEVCWQVVRLLLAGQLHISCQISFYSKLGHQHYTIPSLQGGYQEFQEVDRVRHQIS